jgi:hypothetical protein
MRMKTITGMLVGIALAFAFGCAKTDWIDRTLVTVDVTGTWYGRSEDKVVGAVQLELEQQGSMVKGFVRFPGGSGQPAGRFMPGPIHSTVAGDVFNFRDSRGGMEGELTVSGDEMNGRATMYAGSHPLSLRRLDSSSRPNSPPR